jgi:hypothetical protein
VLDQDADEALQRAKERPVNDVRGVLAIVRPDVGAPEPRGLLAVELDRPHLPRPAHRVVHEQVDLRPVERALSFHHLKSDPLALERRAEQALSVIPLLIGAELVLWSSRQLRVGQIAHAEAVVEEADVVEHLVDLRLHLIFAAEDV